MTEQLDNKCYKIPFDKEQFNVTIHANNQQLLITSKADAQKIIDILSFALIDYEQLQQQ